MAIVFVAFVVFCTVGLIVSLGFVGYFCVRWFVYKSKRKYTLIDHTKDFIGLLSLFVPKLLNEEERTLMRGIALSAAAFLFWFGVLVVGLQQFQ